MRVCIHRGAEEIGGNCIELEHGGYRIVLDVGLPLHQELDTAKLPQIEGLSDGKSPALLGVIISHPHQDHYGLLPKVHPDVPIYIGEKARNILSVAAVFTTFGLTRTPAGFLYDRRPFTLGPFTITPYIADHSAFDGYSLLVEAGGERLFYSGDLRGHGRTGHRFRRLISDPPSNIDVMLLEGTCLGSDVRRRSCSSEYDVERAYADTCTAADGMVLAMFSPQNIDRLVSVYKACVRSGRHLVMDLYTAMIARATGCASIPQASWKGVRVYLPKSQRRAVIRNSAFEMTSLVRSKRIYAEELLGRRRDLVTVFRDSMKEELSKTGCLEGGSAVWSMWRGYLETEHGKKLRHWFEHRDIPLVHHHSSGHADSAALTSMAHALRPGKLVPIHTMHATAFEILAANVTQVSDRSWFSCR